MVVERIEESCGCLSAGIAKGDDAIHQVAPGTSGKIEARFTAGGHRGLLRKSIHVRFVGHDKPVELVAEATIPSHVEISSQDLAWEAADAGLPKTVTLTSGTGKSFAITALHAADAHALAAARDLAADLSQPVLLRKAAIALIGQHGGENDIASLETYAGENFRLAQAADPARTAIQHRLANPDAPKPVPF